jgi:hypothetical protein
MKHVRAVTAGAISIAVPLVLSGCDPTPSHELSASWSMNEAPGATVAVDTSGAGHDGAIEPGVEPAGGYYHFTGTGRVIVPDDPAGGLDPYTRDAYVQVTLRTTDGLSGMNVVQKGQAGSPGGWWKLEVNEGHVACTFGGTSGTAGAWLVQPVADGAWHTVTCGRIGDTVVAAADYGTDRWQVNSVATPTGLLRNGKPLTIGGKIDCATLGDGCDGFVGDIDAVQIW